VTAITSCPVLHFSVVIIFFWSFGIIDPSTFKFWKLSIAQAGASRVGNGMLPFLLSFMYRLN
jgi:hypothetical protein